MHVEYMFTILDCALLCRFRTLYCEPIPLYHFYGKKNNKQKTDIDRKKYVNSSKRYIWRRFDKMKIAKTKTLGSDNMPYTQPNSQGRR